MFRTVQLLCRHACRVWRSLTRPPAALVKLRSLPRPECQSSDPKRATASGQAGLAGPVVEWWVGGTLFPMRPETSFEMLVAAFDDGDKGARLAGVQVVGQPLL